MLNKNGLWQFVIFVLGTYCSFVVDGQSLRNEWHRAIINDVFPDRENAVRRVRLNTASGLKFVRDVQKVCLLEGVK